MGRVNFPLFDFMLFDFSLFDFNPFDFKPFRVELALEDGFLPLKLGQHLVQLSDCFPVSRSGGTGSF